MHATLHSPKFTTKVERERESIGLGCESHSAIFVEFNPEFDFKIPLTVHKYQPITNRNEGSKTASIFLLAFRAFTHVYTFSHTISGHSAAVSAPITNY